MSVAESLSSGMGGGGGEGLTHCSHFKLTICIFMNMNVKHLK